MLAEKTHTSEEMKNICKDYFTVGQLRELLKDTDIPDDAKIFVQRAEDVYFEKYGWSTIKMENDEYYMNMNLIEKAKPGGAFHNKEEYPGLTEERIQEILESSQKDLDECRDEYIAAWYGFKYKDDKNGIYFTVFY